MRKSKTKYSSYLKTYQRKVSALRRQGIELMGSTVYQSERELRKWGIKGQDLAKITRQLKKDIANINKQQAFTTLTGEISTVGELKHQLASERAKRSAETRKKNKESAKAFWTGEEQTEIHLSHPQLGEIASNNFYDEFISRLQSPVSTTTLYGSKRKFENIRNSEEAQRYLQGVWRQVTARESLNTIGERLERNWDMVQGDIELIMISSDGQATTSAMHRIAKVLQGRALTNEERQAVNEQSEYNSSWDINDSYYE